MISQIRIEAFDLGEPTSLSTDLDLTIYVSSVNDYQPQFLVDDFFVNFTGKSNSYLFLILQLIYFVRKCISWERNN